MARAGEAADPRLPAPASMRRLLRFSKLGAKSFELVRRALDDDGFRARVREVASADRELVGDAGWLLLDRPSEWEEQLAGLVAVEGRVDEERELGEVRRELDHVRGALARAEAQVVELRLSLDGARRELSAGHDLGSRLDHATRRADAAAAARAHAVRELKEFESRYAERTAELQAAHARVAELESEVAALTEQVAAAATPEVRAGAVAEPVVPPPAPAVPAGSPDDLDRQAVSKAVAEASAAAAQLAAALSEASRLIEPPSTSGGGNRVEPGPAASRATRSRRPAPLPLGVFDDSVEAARHLLGLPGVVVLVDGYNVAMQGWPDQPIARQRDRLVDVLAGVGARTGAEVVVVFDGADVGSRPAGARARNVQVRFSPAGVEADDVLIELVREYPRHQPVVVVSDDRRVRDGARAGGANVLAAEQLLEIGA